MNKKVYNNYIDALKESDAYYIEMVSAPGNFMRMGEQDAKTLQADIVFETGFNGATSFPKSDAEYIVESMNKKYGYRAVKMESVSDVVKRSMSS